MPTFLVVDENDDLRKSIMEMLEIIGTTGAPQIVEAKSTREGLAFYRQLIEKPEVIILDCSMLVDDNVVFVEEILRENPQQQIIAIVGQPGDVQNRLKQVGVLQVISKPFRYTVLEEAVNSALSLEHA